MMRLIRFSRGFVPACILSLALILAGITGYFLKGGFNLGVDFQAGLIQELQFAPPAFSLRYAGPGNASVSMDRQSLHIVVSGVGVEGATWTFPYAEYRTTGALAASLNERVAGLSVELTAPEDAPAPLLVQSTQGNPQLGSDPYIVHYLPEDSPVIPIEDVRASLAHLGTVSVQVLGQSRERRFLIRFDDRPGETGGGAEENRLSAGTVIDALEASFGLGGVAVTRSDYVRSRFSKQLADQAGMLVALTLLLILAYASFRFKPQFATGAVLAIAHDALIMVGFIVWTRMEFNTTTIAAILTILGYSINDTIVIFDRIRETRHLYPDDSFVDVLDRSISETLSRTIITTVTTMLAVLSLYIFTTRALYQDGLSFTTKLAAIFGEHSSMKDFALALLVGMISGVYSTIFIASGTASLWETVRNKRAAKVKAASAAAAPARP